MLVYEQRLKNRAAALAEIKKRLTPKIDNFNAALAELGQQGMWSCEERRDGTKEVTTLILRRVGYLGNDAASPLVEASTVIYGQMYGGSGARIQVIGKGQQTTYPQRKDGTHNYDAIIRRAIEYAEDEYAGKYVSLEITRARTDSVAALREGFGKQLLHIHDAVSVRPSDELAARVKVELNLRVGFDALSEILRVLDTALRQIDPIPDEEALVRDNGMRYARYLRVISEENEDD